jgi:outer membrane protein assembly factor BamB
MKSPVFTAAVLATLLLFQPVAARGADWPMWGGAPSRNMVNMVEKNIPTTWDIHTGQNVKWVAQLGSQSYATPVVAGGRVYVGTNNQAQRFPKFQGDKGVVMCFDEADGRFLGQLTHDKLAAGRVNDWPQQGVCSSAAVEGNRLYYVSNRCELICADADAFQKGPKAVPSGGATVWKLDMIKELGVLPHNMSASSPVIDGDLIFVISGNGVDELHKTVPAPTAPSFVAVHKLTGKVAWMRNDPGEHILHGQWSSAAIGVMGGTKQVVFPGGDGRLYAFVPETGDLLWTFECNPKGTVYKLGGLGTKNELIATPVLYDNKVFLGLGQDPEHGEGPAHLYAVDGTRRGDITETGAVWHNTEVQRGLSTVAIQDGILYHADLSGNFRAVDAATGKILWSHDLTSAVWGSPCVVDGKVYIGTEDGKVTIFKLGREEKLLGEIDMGSSVYSTLVAANGVLFVSNRERLYAIQEGAKSDPKKVN